MSCRSYGRSVLMSQREAARLLAAAGIGRSRANRVLRCGLAGEPITVPGALLYESELVEELAAREHVDEEELGSVCPDGILVVRRDVNVGKSRAHQLAAISCGFPMAWWKALLFADRIERTGPVPLVATTCGFVVLGAEVVGIEDDPAPLDNPGPWFQVLHERRLRTGSGRPWTYCAWTSAGLRPASPFGRALMDG